MNKRNRIIYLIIGLFCLFLVASYKIFFFRENSISCTVNTQIYLTEYRLDLVIKHDIAKGKGRSTLNGILYRGNTSVGNLNRTVSYNYSSEGNLYRLKDSRVSLNRSDSITNSDLSHILPPFFIEDGKSFDISFIRHSEGVFTVATGNITIGVCISAE